MAGIDALGFILGAAIAVRLKKGFVPIRKGGKLPVQTDVARFVDYTGQEKSLELRVGAIQPRTRVLVVDEWVETGAQVRAAIELLEKQGGVVIGVAVTTPKEMVGGLTVMKDATAVPASSLPPPSEGTPAGLPASSTVISSEAVSTSADLI